MKERSRGTIMRGAIGSAVLLAAALAGTGCASGESTDAQTGAAASPQSEATAAAQPTGDATQADFENEADGPAGPVTQLQAEQAALAAVGEGQVTWSGPEDDRGAAWEVEVTRPDGSELDVLVAADGSIVKQIDRFTGRADDGAEAASADGTVTLQEAERIAVAAVGEGRVTWSGREDDRGAAYEIEVTRDDGTEVDVLIDAAGNVVQ